MAFIQVKTPSSISSVTWEASVSGVHRYVIAANSLVLIYPGQHLGTADLYDSENDDTTLVLPITSLSTTSTLP
ncbi:unnamed protein product, partial [Rotaria socialis]